MFRNALIATALATTLGTAALAQDESKMIFASDPQTLMSFFFDKGIPAQLTTDGVGDPLIEFRQNGEKMQVYFYDCEENANCLSVQFFSGYNVDGNVGLDTMNQWNTDRRFVRAYLTEDGAARIEMDIATSYHGIDADDFSDLYDLWIESVGLFEERIGW